MFRFRLAGIMRLKDYNEKMRRDELGKCMTDLYLAVEKENEIKDAVGLFKNDIMRSLQGEIDANRLWLGCNYLHYMKERLLLQQEVVGLKKKELERARHRLSEAMKERKMLEKLKEKKYEQYQYEQNKLEQALLDDMAGSRN